MTHRVVLLDPVTPERMEQIGAFLPDGYTLHTAASRSPQDQLQAIAGATYAITGGVPVTAEMMKAGAASNLRAVHKWGVGYDNIDIESARSHGIRVMRTTGSNATAVAETAVGLILAAQRNIVAGHLALLEGEWAKGRLAQTCTLVANKTVGLVGLGYIGKSVARILRGFGCTTLYSKPTALSGEEERELGVTYAELTDLLDRCDVVSLHCALTSQTSGFINAAALARMKRGAYLVNTARGGIVIESDLADAVESGHLGGAAVDVFDEEPVPPGHRLLGLERVIVTPHLAALAAENFPASVQRMFTNFTCVTDGRDPPALDVVV